MTDFARNNETGQYAIRLTGGDWQEVDAETYAQLKEIDAEGNVESFFRGLGNSVQQFGTGMGVLADRVLPEDVGSGGLAATNLEQLRLEQDVRRGVNPLATDVGAVAPDVALGAATGLTGTALKRTATTAAVEGTLSMGRNPENPAVAFGIGAGLGGGAVASAPLVRRFVRSANRAVRTSRVAGDTPDALAAQGYRDPWYAGRSKPVQDVGAAIESNPILNLATRAGPRAEARQDALNRVVMEDIFVRQSDDAVRADDLANLNALNEASETGNALTAEFLQTAEAKFVDEFADIATNIDSGVLQSLRSDGALTRALNDLEGATNKSVVRNTDVDQIVRNVKEAVKDGGITGDDIMQMRMDLLSEATRLARDGQKSARNTVSEVVEALDMALERALSKAGKSGVTDAWKDITRRYLVLKAAEQGRAIDGATGNVNARTMMNNLSTRKRKNTGQATNSYKAARHYTANANTGVPNSGTATRQLLNQPISTAIAVATGVGVAN